MRVSGILGGELALSHRLARLPRTFHPPRFVHTTTTSFRTVARMASDNGSGSEWTAHRVRDTFLDYFKQNGHTFGGF